jgi:hypothetical protein
MHKQTEKTDTPENIQQFKNEYNKNNLQSTGSTSKSDHSLKP